MRVYYLDPFTEYMCVCTYAVHAFTCAVRTVVVGTAAGIVELKVNARGAIKGGKNISKLSTSPVPIERLQIRSYRKSRISAAEDRTPNLNARNEIFTKFSRNVSRSFVTHYVIFNESTL